MTTVPTASELLTVRTLTDGGQKAADVANEVAEFLRGAKKTLDIAQYDFHLAPETAAVAAGAIKEAAARGVAVRMIYDVGHRNPIPVPPPPEPDVELISSLGVPHRPIAGIPDLMHHKYVVRDGETVWTGSANWTDDSWSRQENVIAVVESPKLAAAFTKNFEELWSKGVVEQKRVRRAEPCASRRDQDARLVHARLRRGAFPPDREAHPAGEDAGADLLSGADRRTGAVGPLRATRQRPRHRGLPRPAADRGRHLPVGHRRERRLEAPVAEARAEGAVLREAVHPVGARHVHDFMHAKVTVVDDVVFTGSFNLSRSGEQNAENVLEIEDAALAERLAGFVDEVRARYPRFTPA